MQFDGVGINDLFSRGTSEPWDLRFRAIEVARRSGRTSVSEMKI